MESIDKITDQTILSTPALGGVDYRDRSQRQRRDILVEILKKLTDQTVLSKIATNSEEGKVVRACAISDAIIPFFKSWPNQLNRNEIKLYRCKEHGHYWLQPQDISPVCPYTLDKSLNCSDIEEVINKK